MIRLTPTGPQWPYSDAQLRADEPATLFAATLTAEDRAAFGVIEPEPTTPPSYDPATERIEEVHPIEVDGQLVQQWAVVELTAEEQDAYRRKLPPEWRTFKAAMLSNADVNAVMTAAMPRCPLAVLALPAALERAVSGDPTDFRGCWAAIRQAAAVSQAVVDAVVAEAQAANLPEGFVGALDPGAQS